MIGQVAVWQNKVNTMYYNTRDTEVSALVVNGADEIGD